MTIDDAIEFERYLYSQTEICNEGFMTCEEHKQIAEWLEEFKVLKEKAEPKKPIPLDKWGEYHKCPVCGRPSENYLGCSYKFCPNCGCKYDWGNE